MAYTDDVFNTYGKIPTNADFWNQSLDSFVTSEGITKGFGKVLGEQVFRPLMSVRTPFYNRFVGAPIRAGVAWEERALYDNTAVHFNPKATATDALQFYDSQGVSKVFNVNVEGTVRTSIPSDLVSLDMFIDRSGIGTLNSRLVDNVLYAYQNAIESEIEKKAINLTKNDMEVDLSNPIKAFGDIMDKATDMMSDDVHLNELEEDENKNLRTRSESVICFVNAKVWNAYRNARADMPNPNELVSNVEIVPMPNALPTPLTTAEWTADSGASGQKWTGDKPVATDDPAPIAFLVGSGKIEYRPVLGSYKVKLQENSAGDFANQFLHYRGAIAVRPWENSVRVNAKAGAP